MSKRISDHQYEDGLSKCKYWLEERPEYDGLANNKEWEGFGLEDIHFSKSGRGSAFYHRGSPKRAKGKRITIGLRGCDVYSSYLRKIPFLPPLGGIPVDRYDGYQVTLIHELTHFIQHLQGRPYGEVETSRNELAYLLSCVSEQIAPRLISYEERKRQDEAEKTFRAGKLDVETYL